MRRYPCSTQGCGGVHFEPKKNPFCWRCNAERNRLDRLFRDQRRNADSIARSRRHDAAWAAFRTRRDELRGMTMLDRMVAALGEARQP